MTKPHNKYKHYESNNNATPIGTSRTAQNASPPSPNSTSHAGTLAPHNAVDPLVAAERGPNQVNLIVRKNNLIVRKTTLIVQFFAEKLTVR